MSNNSDVIIIGAGMAGLSAAQKLQTAGKRVLILEKSRGVGGRMATRRGDDGQWDHGAQYFTARSEPFRRQVAHWLHIDAAQCWDAPIGVWDGQTLQAASPQQRFVGCPTMNAPLRAMAALLNIKLMTQARRLIQQQGFWQVHTEDAVFCAPELILAIPAPQAARLLPEGHPLKAAVEQVQMQPCWTVMLSSEQPVELPFSGLFINEQLEHDVLSWVSHDSNKPLRTGQHWVLHASVAWSNAHLNSTPEAVATAVCQAFERLLTLWEKTIPHWQTATAHRWLYARGTSSEKLTHTAQDGLMIAGDWLEGGRVEGAFLSGLHAADCLLARQVVHHSEVCE